MYNDNAKELLRVSCESCGVKKGEPCVTKSGGNATYAHKARVDKAAMLSKPLVSEDATNMAELFDGWRALNEEIMDLERKKVKIEKKLKKLQGYRDVIDREIRK